MTFQGVGFPDAQDPGSFVAGTVGPEVATFSAAPGVLYQGLLDPDELTSAVLFHITAGKGCWLRLGTTDPTGGNLTPQVTELLIPQADDLVLPAVNLGGGIAWEVVNTTGSPMNVHLETFNVFRTAFGNFYAQRYTRTATGPALASGAELHLDSLGYEGQYDQATIAVSANTAFTLWARWQAVEIVGATGALVVYDTQLHTASGGEFFAESFPIIGVAADFYVVNDDADPQDVAMTTNIHRLS